MMTDKEYVAVLCAVRDGIAADKISMSPGRYEYIRNQLESDGLTRGGAVTERGERYLKSVGGGDEPAAAEEPPTAETDDDDDVQR